MPVLAYTADYNTGLEFGNSPTGIVKTTTAGYFNSDYVDSAMGFIPTTEQLTFNITGVTDVWINWYERNSATNPCNYSEFLIFGDGVTDAFRVMNVTTGPQCRFEKWNGASYDILGGVFNFAGNALVENTVHLKMDASSGLFEYRRDGSVIRTWTGDSVTNVGVSNITQVRIGSHFYSSNTTYLSEIVIADQDTYGCHVINKRATADGFHTDWRNDYTAIDDNDFQDISPTATNDISTFTGRSIPVGAPPEIVAAKVTAKARQDGTIAVGDDLTLVCRSNGVDYVGSGIDLTAGAVRYEEHHNVDPNTGVAWTEAGLNAAEFGVKAI